MIIWIRNLITHDSKFFCEECGKTALISQKKTIDPPPDWVTWNYPGEPVGSMPYVACSVECYDAHERHSWKPRKGADSLSWDAEPREAREEGGFILPNAEAVDKFTAAIESS